MDNNCKTKYPILLVHGTGFRDRTHLGYWGRIPKALEKDGAVLYYGRQDSWGTAEHNAQTLKRNICLILKETKCEKLNVIAHSKGGLDMRYAISSLGIEDCIASLTTMAAPHHGVKTMDLLWKLPRFVFRFIAFFVNGWYKLLGDKKPDFFAVCRQFTTQGAALFNEQNPDSNMVYYQSYAAVMKNSFSDLLLFWTHLVIYLVEGENDGLVTPSSAQWTNFRGILKGATGRGISHADEVDVRRMNFTPKKQPGRVSDIRDVYIEIVSDLKKLGM